MKPLLWVGFVWCLIVGFFLITAGAAGLPLHDVAGLSLPLFLMLGLWSVGFLLAPTRRGEVYKTLGKLARRG